MSRIGQKPIPVPAGVKVQLEGKKVRVEGPKGKLDLAIHPRITVAQQNGQIVCTRSSDERESRALHGLFRNLIANMVTGVTTGFSRKLEIVGVGFNAAVAGKTLSLTVGFSHPVKLAIPEGLQVTLADPTHIAVTGPDKQRVGQFAAEIRKVRKPEPYKGTGIRYEGEYVRRKAGKAFGSTS